MAARKTFYFFPVAPADFILNIVAEKIVGTDRIDDVHRIEPTLSTFIRHGPVPIGGMVDIVIPIIIFIIPVHQTPLVTLSSKINI